VLLGLSVGAAVQAAAPEFRADIVKRDPAGVAVGMVSRLYVSGLKARIDPGDTSGGFFITDAAAGTAFFVKPVQHLFMDAGQSSVLSRIFIRVDPKNPCPGWQAAAIVSGAFGGGSWHCERVASFEYRVLWAANPSSLRWTDPKLEFPVKARAPGGSTATLENIRIGAQPAELFVIPPDYRKLDPRALIERIKRSDVWAAPAR
jgi:hypothetical protein